MTVKIHSAVRLDQIHLTTFVVSSEGWKWKWTIGRLSYKWAWSEQGAQTQWSSVLDPVDVWGHSIYCIFGIAIFLSYVYLSNVKFVGCMGTSFPLKWTIFCPVKKQLIKHAMFNILLDVIFCTILYFNFLSQVFFWKSTFLCPNIHFGHYSFYRDNLWFSHYFPKTYLHLFRHLKFRLFPRYWDDS